MAAFAAAEHAKRRLIAELVDLKLPIVGREEDSQCGLAFDPMSSKRETVLTGAGKRLDHTGFGRERRRAPRATAHRDGRALPHRARALPPRDRALLFLPLVGTSTEYLPRLRELIGDPDTDY